MLEQNRFNPRERPCRIERYEYTRPKNASLTWRRVYLACSELPIRHIELCFDGSYTSLPVTGDRKARFTHCLHWPSLLPTQLRELVALLNEALVLPTGGAFDAVFTLDWYKTPDDTRPPVQWENTPTGELVRHAKYFGFAERRKARKELVRRLADALEKHPALNSAIYMVSVPGHAGDGTSTGEQIAADLAQRTGQTLIRTVGRARPQRKDDQSVDLTGMFTMPRSLDAPCVIVDDVYRSGATIREVARVARRAGAPRVYGLVAAKTLRS
ncbi:ComF family protein [Nocardia sp. NPDC059764]|uniref:ComF family protein n=1 Tax=Nocardia sp. NPDC059764 TaxID=3346939 RepID=UPI00365805B8